MVTNLAMERLVGAEYRLRLDFTETLLGSRPTSSVAARWLQQQEREAVAAELRAGRRLGRDGERVPAERADDIAEDLISSSTGDEGADEAGSLAVTGFSADPVTGRLHLWDFQLMGYLKAAAQTLELKVPGKRVAAVSAVTQIQRLAWVFGVSEDPMERRLWLRRADGAYVTEPDGLTDRPLRAQTARGERVSIAVSEQLHPPVWCEARLVLLRGCALRREQLEDVLAYGVFQGLGQWRSGGWGRFVATLEQAR